MDVSQNQVAAQPPAVLFWPSHHGRQRSQHAASDAPWQASVMLSVYKPAGQPAPCHSTCVHGQHSQHVVQLQSQVQQQALPLQLGPLPAGSSWQPQPLNLTLVSALQATASMLPSMLPQLQGMQVSAVAGFLSCRPGL